MLSNLNSMLRAIAQYEKLDPELLEIIDQCITRLFSKNLEYFSYFLAGAVLFVVCMLGCGVLTMDPDIALRLKVLPFTIIVLYYLSKRLQKGDMNPRYRAFAYPVLVAMSCEMILSANGLSRVMGIGIANNILNFVLKISHMNKVEKLLLILFYCLYTMARFYWQLENPTDLVKAIPASLGLLVFNALFFQVDEEINRLLNTRFNNS